MSFLTFEKYESFKNDIYSFLFFPVSKEFKCVMLIRHNAMLLREWKFIVFFVVAMVGLQCARNVRTAKKQ